MGYSKAQGLVEVEFPSILDLDGSNQFFVFFFNGYEVLLNVVPCPLPSCFIDRYIVVVVSLLSHVQLFGTPWTAAHLHHLLELAQTHVH